MLVRSLITSRKVSRIIRGSATGVAAPVTYATLNGAVSNLTMSNGNLTATHSNTILAGVTSTAVKGSDKYYFEVTPSVSFSANNSLGILVSGMGVTTAGSVVGTTCVTIGAAVCTIFANGVNTAKNLGSGFVLGKVFGVAIDLTARLAWFRMDNGPWNGLAIGSENPATGTGGVLVTAGVWAPHLRFINAAASTDVMTANFGASAFAGVVPIGFTPGWPV